MNSLHRNGLTAVKHTQLKSEKCPYMGVIIVFLFVTVLYIVIINIETLLLLT